MKIAIIYDRLGPYHHARLRVAAQRCELVSIEMSSLDKTYDWDHISSTIGFEKLVAFPEGSSRDASFGDVRRRMNQLLDKARPDVIVVCGYVENSSYAALRYALARRIPLVIISDSCAQDATRRRVVERIKSCIVDRFGAGFVSGDLARQYLHSLGMPLGDIFLGCDVVDNAHFAQGAVAARADATALRQRLELPERYFLCIARFVEKKNLPNLLRAYGMYRQAAGAESWKLVLVGSGPLADDLEHLADELEIAEHVVRPGFKQYDELPAYYALGGAFILPSRIEQWGLVVNEAMAAGLPVLVSDHCGCAPDLVEHGRNGFVFQPDDIDALAGHMRQIADGEADAEAMGEAGQRIIADWSPDRFADGLINAAERAMEKPRQRLLLRTKVAMMTMRWARMISSQTVWMSTKI